VHRREVYDAILRSERGVDDSPAGEPDTSGAQGEK
jgi:hypothetical protein